MRSGARSRRRDPELREHNDLLEDLRVEASLALVGDRSVLQAGGEMAEASSAR
jgi:hypothetical protein